MKPARILEALGDLTGDSHPMVTSMREHKGYLYVGGILNNRVGRYKHSRRRSRLDRPALLLGVPGHDPRSAARPLPRQGRHHSADGRRLAAEHAAGRSASVVANSQAPDNLCAIGGRVFLLQRQSLWFDLRRPAATLAEFSRPISALAVTDGRIAGWPCIAAHRDPPAQRLRRASAATPGLQLPDRAGLRRAGLSLCLPAARRPPARPIGPPT